MEQKLNVDQVKQLESTAKPDREAVLTVDRNRWSIFAILAILLCFYLGWALTQSNIRAANNKEVVWLKMYPNGTWDVETQNPGDSQAFFQATIDSLLEEFAKIRYSKNPETISSNFGKTLIFLSPDQQALFTSESGFNAAQMAADVIARPGADRVKVKVSTIDHFDQQQGQFSNSTQDFYRSNIYMERIWRATDGTINDQAKNILKVEWRLIPKEQLIGKDLDYFRGNPIAIEIFSYSLFEDPGYSAKETK